MKFQFIQKKPNCDPKDIITDLPFVGSKLKVLAISVERVGSDVFVVDIELEPVHEDPWVILDRRPMNERDEMLADAAPRMLELLRELHDFCEPTQYHRYYERAKSAFAQAGTLLAELEEPGSTIRIKPDETTSFRTDAPM